MTARLKKIAANKSTVWIVIGGVLFVLGWRLLVSALVCFLSKRQTLALGLVAWISTNFVLYRLGLWWMGWHRPCNCLGDLTDALQITPQLADNISGFPVGAVGAAGKIIEGKII